MAFIRKHILSATLLTVSGMVVPLAAQADVSFYAGAEAGYADIELEELKDSESYNAFLGIRFIDVIGLELGYGSLGEFEAKVGGGRSFVEVDSVMQASIAFHGPLLVFDKARVHAKYGYYQADVAPTIPNGTAKSTTAKNFTYALGMSYPVFKPLSVGLTYQFYNDVEGQAINTYSAGLRLDF
jgi:opacity protein-like surface antigen